jgi:hypothetical protein
MSDGCACFIVLVFPHFNENGRGLGIGCTARAAAAAAFRSSSPALRRSGWMSSTADALIVTAAAVARRPLLTRDKLQVRLADEAGVVILQP